MDIKLDGNTDLDVQADGTLTLTPDLETATAQRLRIKLRTFRGEWFLDTRIGIPFFRDFFVKAPDMGVIRSTLTHVVQDDPGVSEVTRLSLEFENPRKLVVEIDARLVDGALVNITFSDLIL